MRVCLSVLATAISCLSLDELDLNASTTISHRWTRHYPMTPQFADVAKIHRDALATVLLPDRPRWMPAADPGPHLRRIAASRTPTELVAQCLAKLDLVRLSRQLDTLDQVLSATGVRS